ncbi:MAG: T9SS type A sorting domain-containing protein [Saprospiraceae bacterium]|nr:T9SS type A sorting domain-containing protein [Saprospiraceae bacterium]
MKYLHLLLIFAYSNIIIAQQFVNPSNEWFTDDCCYAVGETHCTTYKYSFGDSVRINSVLYYELNTNNMNPFFFDFGRYYREENGRVFMKYTEEEEEFIIYDFNLTVGEQLEIGNSDFSFNVEVISVDSITLNSGEKRKRLEVADASDHNTKTFWIEGVGSALATLNPLHMFSLDCWVDFNCFHTEDIVEYQVGNCQLTSSKSINLVENKISCYPNPASNELIISAISDDTTERLEILDLKQHFQIITKELSPINLSGYPAGMYFAKVTFANGTIGVSKFVKAAN